MNNEEIPILKKTYDLYKIFHDYRKTVAKPDRHTIYERSDLIILAIIESLFQAGYSRSGNRAAILEQASVKLNMLRFFIRLMKDTKTLNAKQYISLQTILDEIGRMLGGWLRSLH
jgi:hypothetical protein